MSETYKILIVDDEPDVLEFLTYNISKEGFEVYSATNGKEAVDSAKKYQPHLVLLDIMMPGMDGVETCEILRSLPDLERTVIAFLTARGEDYSQIAGFEAGADDYITKPIRPKVLISRIKALLKRLNKQYISTKETIENDLINIGDIVINREKYIVSVEGKDMVLPKKEFELLLFLVRKPEKVFSREEIFNNVWGEEVIVGDRTIDVHIRKLREKIGEDHIVTVKGVGYKFTY